MDNKKLNICSTVLFLGLFLIACGQATATVAPATETAVSSPKPTSITNTTVPTETTPAQPSWTLTYLLTDWLITPHDLLLADGKIYVSANIDSRIAVLDIEGNVEQYYLLEKDPAAFDNANVFQAADGRILAINRTGLWELLDNGESTKIASLNQNVNGSTLGADGKIYVAIGIGNSTSILKIDPTGNTQGFLNVSSNRISDLEFDEAGNLIMADAEHGMILRYSSESGIEEISNALSAQAGSGPFYIAFDDSGDLYVSSSATGLALVRDDGSIARLDAPHFDGDIVFSGDQLYGLNIYSASLTQISLNGLAAASQKVLVSSTVPWYIDHIGGVVVGEIRGPQNQYFNVSIDNPGIKETNELLGTLKPEQFTFDDEGNIYVIRSNQLIAVDPSGIEIYRINVPGSFQWDTRIHFNSHDGKIYYYDGSSNSIIRVDSTQAEVFYTFEESLEHFFLATAPSGKIFVSIVTSSGSQLINITDPNNQVVIYRSGTRYSWFHLAADDQDNVYAAFGPELNSIRLFEADNNYYPISLVPIAQSDGGPVWVDPQGFTILPNGVALSAPGILVALTLE